MELTNQLKELLIDIFQIPKMFFVLLGSNNVIPTIVPGEGRVSTWIGYKITKITPLIHAYPYPSPEGTTVDIDIRISSIGSQSESLIESTIFWPYRKDVQDLFDKRKWQLYGRPDTIMTEPIKEGGYSDQLCWYTDKKILVPVSAGAHYRQWWESK